MQPRCADTLPFAVPFADFRWCLVHLQLTTLTIASVAEGGACGFARSENRGVSCLWEIQ